MDKLIAHFFLTKLLWLPVALPICFSGRWLLHYLEKHNEPSALLWCLRLIGIAVIAGLYWLSKRMSYRMTIEGQKFACGVRAGLLDLRFHLAFLPLVGHWFAPRPEDERKHDALS